MGLDPHDFELAGSDSSEAASAAASFAGTRAQLIQRLQVGLFGLAAMVMVLGLADIIMSTAESNSTATGEELPPVNAQDVPPPTQQRDPLAEAGVVPDLPDDPSPETHLDVAPALPAPVDGGNVRPPANAN